MEYNLSADLAAHLALYREFAETHAAAQYPLKAEVPLVWDGYFDVGTAAQATLAASEVQPLQERPAQAGAPAVLDAYAGSAEAPRGLEGTTQAGYAPAVLDAYAQPEVQFALSGADGYPPAAGGDGNLLGQMNDQLKTQARRYPHPIAYRMEAIE